jgi:hypothetical protein
VAVGNSSGDLTEEHATAGSHMMANTKNVKKGGKGGGSRDIFVF